MNRVVPYLLGPELYWIITGVVVRLITRRNQPPDPAITDWLDRYWVVLPLVVVPLTFAFFFLPGIGRWWLLLRIDLAIAVGLAVATTQYCNGMIYHQPSAGPGVGTGWLLMHALGYALMTTGTVIAAVVIWWRSRGTA
jgi:hypothetical protein